MKRSFLYTCWFFINFIFLFRQQVFSQNAVLVNFGSNNCYNPNNPYFSLINTPLSAAPTVLTGCGLTAQLPDFYSVFIAYNPRNNKVYVADVRSGIDTKIWLLDMGLPGNIACPVIPVAPTYSYQYISNNFEFDNNGDLWSFSNYNPITGLCNMDKFDVATGTVINTRQLKFPQGNFPTSISSGDLTILPNGRMFATLGSMPSRLYEIINYSSTSTNATATYLQTLPQDCFGIAYLNGQLEITGINFTGTCYYFDYNISRNILGPQKPFQIGQGPIDNTSLTPSLGVTKQLVNVVNINKKTADLTYEIFVRNIGNVIINDINVIDDLGAIFGAANVLNVSAEFIPGSNAGGLLINPAYNGISNTSLLIGAQQLPNQTMDKSNYFFKVLVRCRVYNINTATIYLNSAIGRGTIGKAANSTLINIADSSNNGTEAAVDPNGNGNAGEAGENIPTPFVYGTLPVSFINVAASLSNNTTALIKWTIATPADNAKLFIIEYSKDGRNWLPAGTIPISNRSQANYQFAHTPIPPGNLFYRIKQVDEDGAYIYSRIVLLQHKLKQRTFIVTPNPASNFIQVSTPYNINGKTQIELYDAAGRKILSRQMNVDTEEINTANLSNGTYLLKIIQGNSAQTGKVLIVH